jgi:hypothetical protein
MGFAVWIEQETAWAQGTHEYRPMGAAVVALNDLFRPRDFSARRRAPDRMAQSFAGLFGSLEEVNVYLRSQRIQKNLPPPEPRLRSLI